MASLLTWYGQQVALIGSYVSNPNSPLTFTNPPVSVVGGIANAAVKVALYSADNSTVTKNSIDESSLAPLSANGASPKSIDPTKWVIELSVPSTGDVQVRLIDQVWTASGGNIGPINGVYIADTLGNVLAIWQRATPLTLTPGGTVIADDLTLRLV